MFEVHACMTCTGTAAYQEEPCSHAVVLPPAGVQSDADKVSEFRAFLRMRRTMPHEFSTYELRNFTRFLLKARCTHAP